MSSMLRDILIYCTIFAAASVRFSYGLSCMPCYHPKTGNYQGQPCEPLPACEKAFRPCGCCPECARGVGEECHGMLPRCQVGLMCTNEEGIAKAEVAWHDHKFRGTCQKKSAVSKLFTF